MSRSAFACSPDFFPGRAPGELLRGDLGHEERHVRDAARREQVLDALQYADGALSGPNKVAEQCLK